MYTEPAWFLCLFDLLYLNYGRSLGKDKLKGAYGWLENFPGDVVWEMVSEERIYSEC